MPLVAVLNNTRIDASEVDADLWRSIHRVRPRVELRCPTCNWRMHAKERNIRYFAHDRNASDCASLAESHAHRLLKLAIAQAVRVGGWKARLEYDLGTRRTDVLAVAPDQTPVAFEIQLSPQTGRTTGERTDDLLNAGARTVWIVLDVSAIGRADLPHLVVSSPDSPRAVGPLRERSERPDPRAEVRLPISEWQALARRNGISLQRTISAILAPRLTWSKADGGWLPNSQVAEHEAARRQWMRADRAARERHERRQRAKQKWLRLRRDTSLELRDRLVDLGHAPASVKIFKGGDSVAHARSVRITGTATRWLVHPAPNRVNTVVGGKLAGNTVIVGDDDSRRALREVGVESLLLAGLDLPEAEHPERSVTIAGHDVHAAILAALRRLQRLAAKSNLSATVPNWTDDGLLLVELSNGEQMQRVGFWRGVQDAYPPASSSGCDLLVVTRGRDAKRLSSALSMDVTAGQSLKASDLLPQRKSLKPAALPHAISRAESIRSRRDELMNMIDDFVAASPPGTVWAHSPIDPERPRAGRLVRCSGGRIVIVCRDPSLIPPDHDAPVIYCGDNPPPGVFVDPVRAAEYLSADERN